MFVPLRHHDHPTPTDYNLPSLRTTKVFVALWDIPENGGCTALVPKTHRLPGEPRILSHISLSLCVRLSLPLSLCVCVVRAVRISARPLTSCLQAASYRVRKSDRSSSHVASVRTRSATMTKARQTAAMLCLRRPCPTTSRWHCRQAAGSCLTAVSGTPVSSSRLSLFVCLLCAFQDLNAHHNTAVLCFPLLQSCATSSSNIVCHAFHLALCGPVYSPAEHQWARSAHGALCLFLLTEFQCRTAMGLRCRAVGDDVAKVMRYAK